jgi:acetyl-CoA acetyltransferase
MLMGPGIAVPELLSETGLTLDGFDLIEMHEAFGGQVLSNLAAWERGWKRNARKRGISAGSSPRTL